MPLQLLADTDIALTSLEAVDGADVVEPATGHKAARGGIRTGHHPAGPQGDGMNLHKHRGGGVKSRVQNDYIHLNSQPSTHHTLWKQMGSS